MRESAVPPRVVLVGVVLWSIVLVLAAVLLGPAVMGAVVDVASADAGGNGDGGANASSANGTNATAGEGVQVFETENGSMQVDGDGGVDLGLDVGSFSVGLRTGGLGEDWAVISMESEAIDEGVERDATAGLCAVGLASEDSPVNVTTDGESGTVNATVSASSTPESHEGISDPQAVVEECTTR